MMRQNLEQRVQQGSPYVSILSLRILHRAMQALSIRNVKSMIPSPVGLERSRLIARERMSGQQSRTAELERAALKSNVETILIPQVLCLR